MAITKKSIISIDDGGKTKHYILYSRRSFLKVYPGCLDWIMRRPRI
jgi:hypothetical protein